MKLFVLLSRFPYPLEKGDKLRAFHQIKELSAHFEIHLCALTDETVTKKQRGELEPYCKTIHTVRLKKWMIYLNTAFQFFTDKPYQVGYFFQSSAQRKIHHLINQINPDQIYCQLIRTTEYVKNIHSIPKTLDYQDALSKGMFRRAEIYKGIKKRLFHIEGKRLSEYENRIFDFFNHHTIISEQDRSFINHPSNQEIKIIKNGISDQFFTYPYSKREISHDLVFTGNMNYAPNIECAEFIVNEILPHLDDSVTLLLAGASPHQRVRQLASDRVTVTGWVDDIRDAYASAKLFVAPLFIGTGLQNKLLEAMAMGIPCITTPLTNNALEAEKGKEIMIARNANEFASQIQELMSDEQKYDQLKIAANSFVKKNFSWSQAVQPLVELLNDKADS